ncbi:MAG: hypothetical protein RI911_453 [Candidatus Parcubacteria bacterium]|jgi:hypothetical protein
MGLNDIYRFGERVLAQKQSFEHPPSRALRVAYVIPIQDEIQSANIFLNLWDAVRQDVPHEHFEMMYVVNSTRQQRYKGDQAYYANRQLISILAYAGGHRDDIPQGIEEWQLSILRTCREKKLTISVLDESVPGEQYRSIEGARTKGDNHMKERFKQTDIGDAGALVVLDTDTRFTRRTTRHIDEQLVARESVSMIHNTFDMRPHEGTFELYATTAHYRAHNALGNLNMHLGIQDSHNGWYAVKVGSLPIRTPRMVRPFMRDGFVPRKGKRTLGEDTPMYTQDRARPRSEGGAFGERRLLTVDGFIDIPETEEDPALLFLYKHLERLRQSSGGSPEQQFALTKALINLRPHLQQRGAHKAAYMPFTVATDDFPFVIRILLEKHPEELQQFERDLHRAHEIEARRLRHTIQRVRTLVDRVYTITGPLTVQALLGDARSSSRPAHFFKMNPWMLELLTHVRDIHTSPSEAFEQLRNLFPDLLSPLEETTYTRCTATCLGVRRFVERVENHPDRFPFFHSLIRSST